MALYDTYLSQLNLISGQWAVDIVDGQFEQDVDMAEQLYTYM